VGYTDAQGVLTVAGVPEGAFVVEARKTLEGATASSSFPGTVVLADDAVVKNVAAAIRRTFGSVRATVVDRTRQHPHRQRGGLHHRRDGVPAFRGYTNAAGQFLVSGVPWGRSR
jgi:hypothetical protein